MSFDIAIKVENLSKCYHIYDKPHERLLQMFNYGRKKYHQEYWALKDATFDVRRGETVGIIGRNGSGKSTLLQLICGTLNPTSGRIKCSGRIAALLELGSGFNPEFTGRENVFMNASVMGVSNEEIDAWLNDIVAFADIGEFIDQPVKTYSSGMYVRLAFSVAVHIQPEILIVDEALSVGDIAFQNKCIAKIKYLKQCGVSVLFVSHDLSTVQIICDRVIWIGGGSVILDGDPIKVCQDYYAATIGTGGALPLDSKPQIPQQATGMGKFMHLRLLNSEGVECRKFSPGDEMRITFELMAESDLEESVFTVSVYRADGDWMIGQTSREENIIWPGINAGETLKGTLILSPNCLAPNDYMVAFAAFNSDLSICYALTEIGWPFSVRAAYQTWGKFIHPCIWMPHDTDGVR